MPDDDEKSKIVQSPQVADAIKQLSINPALVASIDKAAKALDKVSKLNLPSARQMEVFAKAAIGIVALRANARPMVSGSSSRRATWQPSSEESFSDCPSDRV